MKTWLRSHLLFVALVVVPTIGSVLYFGIIASDVYVSESRFLVRNPQQSSQSEGLVGMLMMGGAGGGHSADDTYAVRDYIISRDALKELQASLNIRKSYELADADFLDRFPGPLHWNDSFEDFFRYYGKHITVEYDPVSAISVLTVRAFRAEDAYKINNALVEMSERLVNTLNDRSRHDMIQFAENEVHIASEKAKDAAVAMLTYRNSQSVFEPNKQATIELEGVAKVQEELISTEAAVAELRKLSPDNPQIGGLNSRAESLRAAIASEAAKVTGAGGTFSTRAANFERLALDVDFTDKQLGTDLAELESARAKAVQKQLYLERLVQPNLPDKAIEPHRFRSIVALFIMSLVVWAVASVLIASVREHAD